MVFHLTKTTNSPKMKIIHNAPILSSHENATPSNPVVESLYPISPLHYAVSRLFYDIPFNYWK